MNNTELTIAVLAENTAHGMGFLGEHGLSFWIEGSESRMLFDTGQGMVMSKNAERLGIDLEDADAIVLSHGHYDHVGGLCQALRQAPKARLFLHPTALVSRFSCREGKSREIGMAAPIREEVHERRASITWTTGPTEVSPGIFATGPIPRRNTFEDTGGPFFLDAEGRVPDPIEDDQALWIEMPAGVVVLLGCAHSGVVNTLDYIRDQTGGKSIRAVLGGLHLGSASDERIARTIEALRGLNCERLGPCHCTGAVATAKLMTAFGNRCRPCAAGMMLKF